MFYYVLLGSVIFSIIVCLTGLYMLLRNAQTGRQRRALIDLIYNHTHTPWQNDIEEFNLRSSLYAKLMLEYNEVDYNDHLNALASFRNPNKLYGILVRELLATGFVAWDREIEYHYNIYRTLGEGDQAHVRVYLKLAGADLPGVMVHLGYSDRYHGKKDHSGMEYAANEYDEIMQAQDIIGG